MKFKIGDKVRIKDGIDHTTNIRTDIGFLEEMDRYIGKILIINEIYFRSESYTIKDTKDIGDLNWYFAEEWLELAE